MVPAGRVVGLDVARCLALLGMMATHMLPGYDDGGVPWPQQLAGGRAAALFAVLAGVSLALMSGRTTPVRGRERLAVSTALAVRAVVIAAVGLTLGLLDSGLAVILTYYGLLFLAGLPFLGLRTRPLVILTAGWVVAMPVLSHVLRPELPAPSLDSPSWSMLADPGLLVSELAFTGYYPVLPWLAYLLAGMAVGRLDLGDLRVAVRLVVVGAATATAAWSASWLLLDLPDARRSLLASFDGRLPAAQLDPVLVHGLHGTTPTDSWWWLAVVTPHTATPFDLAQTIGSALAVIGLCLLVSRPAPALFAVVFGAGAMTLTLYSAHVVMRTPDVWPPEEPSAYWSHVSFALLVGAAFRLARLRGPLEWLVARVSSAAAAPLR